jgi:hypothetical protein
MGAGEGIVSKIERKHMELGKLGTTTDESGNSVYDSRNNPLLQQGVFGIRPMGMGMDLMNPRNFATPAAATTIAQAVGGEVINDPMAARWNTTFPVLAIRVGNKTANAGNICDVLGNDCGFAVPVQKSEDICGQLGIPFDRNLADVLYSALTGK